MIDLHAHILPGIDDGPRTLAQSLKMAERYVAAGYSRVTATPHWVAGSRWQPTPEAVREALDALGQAMTRQGLALEVAPGAEIAMTLGVAHLLSQKRVWTLNDGAYALIEPPFQQLPLGWEQILFEVSAAGYRVLLAHPERCAHLARQPRLVQKMKAMEVGLQINYKSLLGRYGNGIRETAWSFLEAGLGHCVATDSHQPGDIDKEALKHVNQRLTTRLGAAYARLLAHENPQRVWNGEPLQNPAPIDRPARPKRRKWGFKWW